MSKISVFIRIKGGIPNDNNNNTITVLNNDSLLLTRGTYESRKYTQFDGVFEATQQQVYNKVCKTTISDILNGYNVSIMAFGQSNAGKSYTIGLGDCEGLLETINQPIGPSIGLFPRIAADLFNEIHETQINCNIELSYTQIYRDCVYDLLDPEMSKLQGKMMFQPRKIQVGSLSDVLRIVSQAGKRRVIAGTLMNEASSRSHVILTLIVRTSRHTTSRLTVVDLAGSERVNRTNSHGTRLAEANSINKSLTALGKCIRSLSLIQTQQTSGNSSKYKNEQRDLFSYDQQKQSDLQKKSETFVPYRDSLLTRLLQESLSGNSKTTIIATISPLPCDYDESNSTLQFALRCTKVSMTPTANFALFQETNQEQQNLVSAKLLSHQQIQPNQVIKTAGEFCMDGGVGTVECQCPSCGVKLKIYDQLEENLDDIDTKIENNQENDVESLQKLIRKLEKENAYYKQVTKELLGAYERVRGIEQDINQFSIPVDEIPEEISKNEEQNFIHNESENHNTQKYDDMDDEQLDSSLPPLHPNTVDRLMQQAGYESTFLRDMQMEEEKQPEYQFNNQLFNNKSQTISDIRSKAQEISPTATNNYPKYNFVVSTNTDEQHSSEDEEVTVPLVLQPPSFGQSSIKPITINKVKPYQPFYAPKQIKLSGKYPQLKYNVQSKALIETND